MANETKKELFLSLEKLNPFFIARRGHCCAVSDRLLHAVVYAEVAK